MGLAFVTPQIYYSIAMGAGSVFNHFWALRNPSGYEMYMFAVSAGMLAGEGLGGVFQALLAIIGVDGGSKHTHALIIFISLAYSHCFLLEYGSAIGCPGFEYCG